MVTVGSEQVAGRYTLVREVGRGGMGAVWLAHDELLGRDVALKRLGQFQDAQNRARAQREARIAARLSHRNVVTVFDLAEDGETRWLVMEYVEGTTLSKLAADRGGLPTGEATSIIRQAAEALRVAHEAGIVHRDVKPSNLIVADDGTTKLTDFGIARGAADDTLTSTGILTGSPAYIAPEVASGGLATPASDMWSLGGSLFQAVTGRTPYDLGDNVVAGLVKIVQDEPPRLPPGSGPLSAVLAATMVKEPERRWTAAQVCAFLDGAPVTAPETVLQPAAEPSGFATRLLPAAPAGTATALTPTAGMARMVRGRRRPVLLWPVSAALLVVVLVLGAWLLGRSDSPDLADPPPSTPATTPPPSSPAAGGASAEGMAGFVTHYLSTVTSDPRTAFAMLTPAFQRASGGYGQYSAWWAPIRSASVSNLSADPASMTVSYHVAYDAAGNRPSADDVRLRLVYEAGRYLIDGEPK